MQIAGVKLLLVAAFIGAVGYGTASAAPPIQRSAQRLRAPRAHPPRSHAIRPAIPSKS
jgi:hypothetical protein